MTTIDVLPTLNSSVQLSPSAGTNAACVGDGSDSTSVGGTGAAYATDIYYTPIPFSLGTINSITVFIRAKTLSSGKAKTVIYIPGGTSYLGSEITLTGTWTNYSTTYNTNPAGGEWQYGNAPRPGVSLYGAGARCAQVSMRYNITPSAGTITRSTSTSSGYRYYLYNGQILSIPAGVTITRPTYQPGPMVVASPGSKVTGGGVLDGAFISSSDPLISATGTVEISGLSAASPLTVKNNLYHGAQITNPSNCLIQYVNFEDCRSGTSTVPVIGDASLGMGLWLTGAGTTNTLSYCNFKRCGMDGFQFYGNDYAAVDHVNVDGVYGYFGGSFYQSDHSQCTNSVFKNTRREGFNAAECDYTTLTDIESYDAQTDYGICAYMCNHGTITRPIVQRSWKDGISLEGASNYVVTDGELTDVGRGKYVGHHSGIILQGSTGYDCLNNSISGCTITDKHHYLIYPIKEAINTDDIGSNTITNNSGYGTRRKVVRLVGTGSTESGNVWR